MSGAEDKLLTFRYRGSKIPTRMHGGLLRYLQQGILPGSFLKAIICNDLREACSQADDENLFILPVYVSFFYNETPSTCWGSKEKMEAWHSYFSSQLLEPK